MQLIILNHILYIFIYINRVLLLFQRVIIEANEAVGVKQVDKIILTACYQHGTSSTPGLRD